MRHTKLLTLLTLVSFAIPSLAQAYDEDTHFYGTYAMARHAGIKHPVAMKIALSAQWMDESFISDPTSMIFMPITGVKKRRILHFPSSRVNKKATDAEKAIFGLNDLGEFGEKVTGIIAKLTGVTDEELERLNLISVTQKDDPMASQMIFEGIMEGNLMKAATGIHTLEDSFAHAGTPAGAGHAMWWHWPDRPYGSKEKYTEMVSSVMLAMVGIRTMLPREALDCDLKTAAPRNCEADPQVLTETYLPIVMPVISHDMLRDPEYVTMALHEFYARSAEENYLKASESEFFKRVEEIKLVDGKTNAYSALAQIFENDLKGVAAGKPAILDYGKILDDMGLVNTAESVETLKTVKKFGVNGIKNWEEDARVRFAKVVALQMLTWHVPDDMSDSHRMEFEDDKDEVRKFEMEKRVKNMQAFIRKHFGTDIQFVGNNTLDDVGFYKEINEKPEAEPDYMKKPGFTPRPGAVYATFSLKEKAAFDLNILRYLFPSLSKEDDLQLIEAFAQIKRMLMERSEYYKELKAINASDSNRIVKLWKRAALDYKFGRFRDVAPENDAKVLKILTKDVKPHLKPLMHDLLHTHLKPDPEVFSYRRDENFQELIKKNNLKPFLGEKDFWKASELLAPPPAPPASFFSWF